MSDNEFFEPVVLSGVYDPDPPLPFRERRFGFGHLQVDQPDEQADDEVQSPPTSGPTST